MLSRSRCRYLIGRIPKLVGLYALDLVDPFPRIARHAPATSGVTLIGVYRARNAGHVKALLDDTGWPAQLWALDHQVEGLPTVGVGPGTRFALLNGLAELVAGDQTLVITDDDVTFEPGVLAAFVGVTRRLKLDLAMPAHNYRSQLTFPFTVRRPLRTARLTTFVEIGPVLAIAPTARPSVMPFPTVGMGWGTELLWYDLWQAGARLGIVDATPMRHKDRAGSAYDTRPERDRMLMLLAERGLSTMDEIQRTVRSTW